MIDPLDFSTKLIMKFLLDLKCVRRLIEEVVKYISSLLYSIMCCTGVNEKENVRLKTKIKVRKREIRGIINNNNNNNNNPEREKERDEE